MALRRNADHPCVVPTARQAASPRFVQQWGHPVAKPASIRMAMTAPLMSRATSS